MSWKKQMPGVRSQIPPEPDASACDIATGESHAPQRDVRHISPTAERNERDEQSSNVDEI